MFFSWHYYLVSIFGSHTQRKYKTRYKEDKKKEKRSKERGLTELSANNRNVILSRKKI